MSRVEPIATSATTGPTSRISGLTPAFLAVAIIAAGLALALLPPSIAIWVVFGGGLSILVVARPIVGLYVLPFAVAFGSLIDLTVHGIHIGPTDLLVGALALAWLVRAAPRLRSGAFDMANALTAVRAWRRQEPLRFAVFGALLAYLAVVTVSLAVATDRIATLKEILKWGEVVAVVGLGVWALTDLARIRTLAWMILAAATLEAGVGYVQWVMGGQDRILGTFAQPNPLAGFLNFAAPLAIALVLLSPDAAERWLAGAAGVVVVGGEVFARSRGATVGLAAAVAVIVVVGYHRERLAAWVAAVGVPLAALAWVAHLIPRGLQQQVSDQIGLGNASLCDHINNANFSTMERLAQWLAGLRMFASHPLLGVGAGNYNAAYARYATSCWPDALGHAHNYYITTAAETGALGLAAFLLLTGVTVAIGWWASRASPAVAPASLSGSGGDSSVGAAYHTRLARALAIGFSAALVALAVHNLFDDLFVHAMELQFALCLAALLRLGVLARGGG